jgi:hypothetical protein
MSRSASIAFALLPVMAAAQEPLPTVEQAMALLRDTEVRISGHLGIGSRTPVTDFWLILEDGTQLALVFDPAASGLPRFEGCFYSPGRGGTPCAIKGYGHLGWEGASLQVVLSTVEEVAPPGPLP